MIDQPMASTKFVTLFKLLLVAVWCVTRSRAGVVRTGLSLLTPVNKNCVRPECLDLPYSVRPISPIALGDCWDRRCEYDAEFTYASFYDLAQTDINVCSEGSVSIQTPGLAFNRIQATAFNNRTITTVFDLPHSSSVAIRKASDRLACSSSRSQRIYFQPQVPQEALLVANADNIFEDEMLFNTYFSMFYKVWARFRT
eukprot:Gregarina_sp_Pseudo_9__3028@NODE_3231_length_710_cov_2_685544_g2947_i0_p1_GENE_NODE_3231_length_710_cov_2_685544_g2947_i0NODE_3231_length_710_cov_2_685544_g2947_i0_p1_ORF_typecomplete_len198_score30_61_NODE_3231_length_710_cov_2_685544_g2947_i070663